MYDAPGTDSKREWIELYNSGDTSVPVSSIKLIENDSNHNLVGDSESIPPDTYLIVASDIDSFKLDHPEASGYIYDSVFSLVNTGEKLAVSVDGVVTDEISYTPFDPVSDMEYSIQIIDSRSYYLPSTPLSENVKSESVENETEPAGDSSQVQSGQSKVSKYIKTKTEEEFNIGRDRIGYPGIPLRFDVISKKEIKSNQNIIWSFGDGSKDEGISTIHSFSYPGSYIVTARILGGDSLGFSRTTVNVLDRSVSVIDANSEYIEVNNPSESEINIGRMRIVFENDTFTLPTDTIILPQSSVRLPIKSMILRRDVDFSTAAIEYPKKTH